MWDLTIHSLQGLASSLALVPFSNRCGTLDPPPFRGPMSLQAYHLVSTSLWGLASSLAHCPVSSSNTICNIPSPPLTDIILFGFSLSGFPSKFLKRVPWERFPHPYKKCFVLLPNKCGISQSTPLQGPASSLALVPFSNRCRTPQSTPFRSPASLLVHRLVSTSLRGLASSLAHHPMSGSGTICYSPNSLLADIVLFELSLSGLPSRLLKRVR